MKRYKQFLATVILGCCMTQVQAQEISFTALPGAATPGLGELIYDSTSDRLYIASGGNTVKVVDTSGTPDVNFAGDGILGNDAGEEPLLDAEYLAVSGNRVFISDQERGVILVVNATSGALDTSLATDGIIGNDPTEPDFTGLTLHDIEALDDQLYIATNSNIIIYALDGSDTNGQFSAFPAQTLTIGPLTATGNCSTNAIFNNQLLYAFTPNGPASLQGTVACLDNTGAAQILAQTNDISLTDLTFAAAAGDTCGTQTRFSNGNIAYIASRRFDTEIQCIGGDGARAIFNDMTIGASTGIASANDRLYVREVGSIGMIYQSEILNNTPTITAQSLTIDENTSSPLLITTVIADDLDPGAVLDNWMIQSGNISVDGDGDLPFSIDANSGEININDVGDLDRELADKFDLLVTVNDGISTSSPTLISINLNDLNEFDPQINMLAAMQFNENLNQSFPIATATGSDGDATAVLQNWSITSGNVSVDGDANLPFMIDPDTGLISVNDSGDIDRELVSSYNLVLQVSDGEVNSATSGFTITILDLNEFNPTIANQTLSLDENTINNTPVTIATAIDGDATAVLQNWMITAGNMSIDGDGNAPFAINPSNGQIIINDSGDIDRELTSGYSLMVTVFDGEITSSPATIQININDINEFTPIIDSITPLTIDENPTVNSPLLTATAIDEDETSVLQGWTITSGNLSPDGDSNPAFSINPTSGILSINDADDFDRELIEDFNLTITVSDGVNTSQQANFILSLNDVNEFTPVVDDETLFIDENTVDATLITTIVANDEDATAVLQDYTILSGNTSLDGDADLPFAIDATDGRIIINDSGDIDRELTSGYTLTVNVSDGTLTSENAIIQVNINDINKSPPSINALAPINIDENPIQNSTLVTATATDDDATAVLQDWTIVAGNISLDGDNDLAFFIDPNTGEISFNDAEDIDRELTNGFVLSLTVSDGTFTSNIEDVTITLNDINEFSPEIDSVTPLLLNEDEANNTQIVSLTAVDDDATSSLQDWMIISGNTDLDQDGTPPFSINLATGVITLVDNGDLDSQQISTFVLGVTVSDGLRTSAVEPITIQLAPVPSFVTATNDAYQITEGQSIMIPADGVLINDEDENGESLQVDQVNGASGVGLNTTLDIDLVIDLSSDGSLFIDATQVTNVAEGQTQVVIFSYRATNGIQNDIATVSITVQGINHAPSAQDDLFEMLEDKILNKNVIDDNGMGIDIDPDQGQNTFIENPASITLSGIGGDLLVNDDGSFTYTPPADTFGTAMFTYNFSDGTLISTATAVIDVTEVNDKPSFIPGENQFLSSGSTGVQTIPLWATAISAGPNEDQQTLNFSVTSTADPDSVVSAISLSTDGTLEYTLTANQGLARFDVLLIDDGGTDDGGVDRTIAHELIISNQDGVNIVTLLTDNRITVEDGEQLTYEIIISNEGPQDAISANVNNNYSSELINVSWTCTADTGASCSANGTNNIIDSIDLSVGSHVTYILTATVDGTSGIIEHTVTAIPALIIDELFFEDNIKTDLTIIGEEVFKDGFE
jgi:uncharacterized repeat protein (TIGR01451 family)